MKEHADWVRASVLPRARQTNRLPPELYADNLKNFGVDADPRELMHRAQFAYLQTRDEMDVIARLVAGQRGWKAAGYREVIRALKKERIDNDRLLEVYRARLGQVEGIARRERIVTLQVRAPRIGRWADSASLRQHAQRSPREFQELLREAPVLKQGTAGTVLTKRDGR